MERCPPKWSAACTSPVKARAQTTRYDVVTIIQATALLLTCMMAARWDIPNFRVIVENKTIATKYRDFPSHLLGPPYLVTYVPRLWGPTYTKGCHMQGWEEAALLCLQQLIHSSTGSALHIDHSNVSFFPLTNLLAIQGVTKQNTLPHLQKMQQKYITTDSTQWSEKGTDLKK